MYNYIQGIHLAYWPSVSSARVGNLVGANNNCGRKLRVSAVSNKQKQEIKKRMKLTAWLV